MSRTADLLNGLLADAVVYYYKLHNYHWFVTGDRFKELHERFEELYENAHTDLDDLAERVLTVGGRPIGTLESALEHASIKEETGTPDAGTMIARTIADLRTRLERIHQTAEAAEAANDRGTAALMDDLTGRIEKSIWMLEASKER